MKLKTIITDDEPMSRKLITQFSERTELLEVTASFASAEETRDWLTNNKVDLLLLDINMPGMTGMDLVRSTELIPQIILITAHKDFAVEAFDYDITDYLIKPIQYARFFKAIQKAHKQHTLFESDPKNVELEQDTLFVKVDARIIPIELKEILYFEAYGDYVKVFLNDRKYVVHSTMIKLEKFLPVREFVRIHRKFIVRINAIEEIWQSGLQLANARLPVSKAYRKAFLEAIKLVR